MKLNESWKTDTKAVGGSLVGRRSPMAGKSAGFVTTSHALRIPRGGCYKGLRPLRLFGKDRRRDWTKARWTAVACGVTNGSLSEWARVIESSFREACVENAGRAVAASLADFVSGGTNAFLSGHSLEKLQLEIEFETGEDVADFHLTSSERSYRQQWLKIIYATLQMLTVIDGGEEGFHQVEGLGPWKEEDEWMMFLVERTLKGQITGEEQSMVTFDRALATRGASGGVAAEGITISPQFVPISQLILLTSKVYKERTLK